MRRKILVVPRVTTGESGTNSTATSFSEVGEIDSGWTMDSAACRHACRRDGLLHEQQSHSCGEEFEILRRLMMQVGGIEQRD